MINLGTVSINKKVKDNVKECLDEGRIGSGSYLNAFESGVADFVGVEHGIATCNGTMADMVALAVIKNLYPNKREVIVPALTFIAQTNSILFNELEPVFVDVKDDLQIDETKIKEKITGGTLAIMPTHLLGKRCNVEKIKEIAGDIPVIEDCCEAFGVKPIDIGTVSFYPSHTITTGEGGMVLTDDDKYAEIARKLINHGRKSDKITEKFHFDIVGFNGKMSNLTAAVGSGVVEDAEDAIKKRKKNVKYLNKKLNRKWKAESPHAYPLFSDKRDKILKKLEKEGIESRKIFSSLPTQEKAYEYIGYNLGEMPKAEEIGKKGFYVPCHQDLTKKDLDKICRVLKKLL